MNKTNIINKLDLSEFITHFSSYFAREKSYILQGDINLHFNLIQELDKYQFKEPLNINNLDEEIMRLKKLGTLKIDMIFEFVKIIRYFIYLQSLSFEDNSKVARWLEKIIIPQDIIDITYNFTQKELISHNFEDYHLIINKLGNVKDSIKSQLTKSLYTKKISPYLVDTQIHYINHQEAILVRGGFNKVIKATIISRSQGGFFYIVPNSVDSLKREENELNIKKEDELYKICKTMSKTMHKYEKFLGFINKEFDRFDHYQARVNFARDYDYNYILPNSSGKFILKNFYHPVLEKSKEKNKKVVPINIDVSKKVVMITGVNAGGKTMLLKSILSSLLLSKQLIPFKVDRDSKIARFKHIEAIIDDPQNVKNDISTFAGRMSEFSRLFTNNNFLVGVDEIELGTDSDEAATLFKVIIEKLMKKDCKIIITTHHKRLASFLASYDEVELIAALYDEKAQLPTYGFMQGTIGKSYAFETAKRYGIPIDVIKTAYEVYGDDKERLNELIERSAKLEQELTHEIAKQKEETSKIEKLKNSLLTQRDDMRAKVKNKEFELEKSYKQAIDLAKEAVKKSDTKEIHRAMNEAHKSKDYELVCEEEDLKLKVGDKVKYHSSKGTILSIQGKNAFIQTDNMKLKVKLSELKRSGNIPKYKQQKGFRYDRPQNANVKLDLHGMRVEEALEECEIFISNSLLANFDEVMIYHGIGSGILGKAVGEFLRNHKSIVSFDDAPSKMGGFGAKIVKL